MDVSGSDSCPYIFAKRVSGDNFEDIPDIYPVEEVGTWIGYADVTEADKDITLRNKTKEIFKSPSPWAFTTRSVLGPGTRTYYVRKILGFFDPLGQLIYTIQFTQPPFLRLVFGYTPSPSHCGQHMSMPPPSHFWGSRCGCSNPRILTGGAHAISLTMTPEQVYLL